MTNDEEDRAKMEFTPEQAAEAAKGAGIDLAAEKFDAKALALGMTAEL